MKENVRRGPHALKGLMFARSVILFSQLNDRIDCGCLHIFYIGI